MEGFILDTSSNRPFLLWAKNGKASSLLLLEEGEALSRRLGAEIRSFLQGRRPSFLAVGTGPGSFTGVRVGVATAKALAFGWGIPLCPFPSLLSFLPPSAEGPFALLADARMGGLYCQRGIIGASPELLPIEKAPEALRGYALFSPHGAQIAKRAHFPQGVADAEPNGDALAALVFDRLSSHSRSPLAPFPLAYLDGKL